MRAKSAQEIYSGHIHAPSKRTPRAAKILRAGRTLSTYGYGYLRPMYLHRIIVHYMLEGRAPLAPPLDPPLVYSEKNVIKVEMLGNFS